MKNLNRLLLLFSLIYPPAYGMEDNAYEEKDKVIGQKRGMVVTDDRYNENTLDKHPLQKRNKIGYQQPSLNLSNDGDEAFEQILDLYNKNTHQFFDFIEKIKTDYLALNLHQARWETTIQSLFKSIIGNIITHRQTVDPLHIFARLWLIEKKFKSTEITEIITHLSEIYSHASSPSWEISPLWKTTFKLYEACDYILSFKAPPTGINQKVISLAKRSIKEKHKILPAFLKPYAPEVRKPQPEAKAPKIHKFQPIAKAPYAPIPQPIIVAAAAPRPIAPALPLLDNYQKYLQDLAVQQVEQLYQLTHQQHTDSNKFDFSPLNFRTIEEVRRYFKIKNNFDIPLANVRKAQEYAKQFALPLIPSDFFVGIIYPEKPALQEFKIEGHWHSVESFNAFKERMQLYVDIKEKLEELHCFLGDSQYYIALDNIKAFRHVIKHRKKILSKTQQMIDSDLFTCYFFGKENKSAIHIENGYLTSTNVFRGVIRLDGTADYDGMQIEQRLDTYHDTLTESYILALKLGRNQLITFFNAFNISQCLDARIYPLQRLLPILRDQEDISRQTDKGSLKMDKETVLESAFMEGYGKGLSKAKIIENLRQRFSGKQAREEIITDAHIQEFVKNKFLLVMSMGS